MLKKKLKVINFVNKIILQKKLIEELKSFKNETLETKENNYYLEEKIKNFHEKDKLYGAIKDKFQEIREENEILHNENESLKIELRKREELEKEWDIMLKNIKTKIKLVQQENECIQKSYLYNEIFYS